MNKKNNFPVKYAVIEIKGTSGFDGFGVRKLETIAFIVSKAYLVKESICYNSDGTYDTKYNVFFPYENPLCLKGERKVPTYNHFADEYSYNSIVSKVFDNYEEAKEWADDCNFSKLLYIYYKDLHEYDKVEQNLLEKLEDMQITPDKVLIKRK